MCQTLSNNLPMCYTERVFSVFISMAASTTSPLLLCRYLSISGALFEIRVKRLKTTLTQHRTEAIDSWGPLSLSAYGAHFLPSGVCESSGRWGQRKRKKEKVTALLQVGCAQKAFAHSYCFSLPPVQCLEHAGCASIPTWSRKHGVRMWHGGTAHHSTVRHSTAQPGTAWHSTTQHGTTWHRTAQHNTARHSIAQPYTVQHSMAQHNMAPHSMARHSMEQHSTSRHSTARHSTAQHGTARHDTTQHGMTQHNTARYSTAQCFSYPPPKQASGPG